MESTTHTKRSTRRIPKECGRVNSTCGCRACQSNRSLRRRLAEEQESFSFYFNKYQSVLRLPGVQTALMQA